MSVGSSRTPSIAEAVQKAASHFEGRKIVTSPPREAAKRFTNRPRPAREGAERPESAPASAGVAPATDE